MKKFLVTVALLGFGFNASADRGLEVQINGGFNGTAGAITINDKDTGDNTPWSLGAEVYKTMGEKLQIGGLLNISDDDNGGDTMFTLGFGARFNFDSELRNAMFVGGGLAYSDFGAADQISLGLSFGKRYALSDNVTYTPNVSVRMAVGGDLDKGTAIVLNLLSFSGFM